MRSRRRSQSDPHSPRRFRVIGPLRNLDAWYDAFKIGPEFEILHSAGASASASGKPHEPCAREGEPHPFGSPFLRGALDFAAAKSLL